MNEEEIKKIFDSKYNRTDWIKLIHDIFKGEETFFSAPQEIAVEKSIADKVVYLGYVSLVDGNRIAIYEVKLSEHVNIERNRAGIRHLLCPTWRGLGFVGAFMLCYRDTESVLRFSYVSESFRFDENGKYTKDSTDPKRYTYLLGEGHRSKTAVQQFMALKNSELTLQNVTKAFSVEALSKRFFNEYKKKYEDIVEYVTGKRVKKVEGKWKNVPTHSPNKEIFDQFDVYNDTEKAEKAVRDYVKKLMGRLVFIQFLQKKGWMGVPANDAAWKNGDKDFVQNLFKNTKNKEKFIDDVLEPLFDDLNTKREKDLVSSELVGKGIKVPYLNGGLFEKDFQDDMDFPLPKNFMEELLDFFTQYNFTIDENDPDDAEVGVDPEMLSCIFENLLEDNKEKGAFYTPKEIVQYMCRESLIAYLSNGVKTNEAKERIRDFVLTHKVDVLNAEENISELVDKKLKDVKICDPAIGSGAFPMGLMRELYFCRSAIEGFGHEKAAEIKKHIIQQNIYGVDIEKGAVDIARLRFWLSLIVDEENPHALPNLDFKIMQGNSLLEQYKGVDLSDIDFKANPKQLKSGKYYDAFDSNDVRARQVISLLKDQYFACGDKEEKKKIRDALKQTIQALIQEKAYSVKLDDINDISATDKFFLWHTWFSEVFENDGFDIVIGNPPYGAKLSDDEKKYCKQIYPTAKTIRGVQKGSQDTFVTFLNLGFNIVKKNGYVNMIVPLSVTASDAMTGLHNLFVENCDDIRISSYGDRPRRIFEGAEQQVSIVMFKKTLSKYKKIMSTAINKRYTEESLWNILDNLQFADVTDFIGNGRIPKIGTSTEISILKKLRAQKVRLSDLYVDENNPVYYRKAGGRYYKIITLTPTHSSAEDHIDVKIGFEQAVAAIMSSTLYYWYWLINSDWHNMRTSEIAYFPIPYEEMSDDVVSTLGQLYTQYNEDLIAKSRVNRSGLRCYYARKSKNYIDDIDRYLGTLYGLSQDEINFIISYDERFRTDDDA